MVNWSKPASTHDDPPPFLSIKFKFSNQICQIKFKRETNLVFMVRSRHLASPARTYAVNDRNTLQRGSMSERACHVISLCCGAGYQSRLELVLCARNETIEVSEGRLLVKASPRHGCIAFGEFYNPTTKLCVFCGSSGVCPRLVVIHVALACFTPR